MTRIYPISLGCPKNRVDTEKLLGAIQASAPAFSLAGSPEEADCVFINTCGFIAPAVEESVRTILETLKGLETLASRPLLAVGGCLIGRYGAEELKKEIPEVDLWLDNNNLPAWPAQLAQALGLAGPAPVVGATPRLLSTGPAYAWLKVSEGCAQSCSFCTIPSIRGPLRSVDAAVLESEARALVESGVKEIILVAQDLTSWGRDLGVKHGLRALLERLLPVSGLKRLRLMYLYPAGVTKELLTFLRQAGAPFVPYFDVPLQHAHPAILKKMGRPFAQSPYKVVDLIREHFPDAALRTSLITGFPGEEKEHYLALRDFVRKARFTNLGVFSYQAEEGTRAAAFAGQVSGRAKSGRRAALMRLQAELSAAWLAQFRGRELEVLIDAPSPEWPGLFQGRAWFQAPEIDGITYVSGETAAPGRLVRGRVGDTHAYDLEMLV